MMKALLLIPIILLAGCSTIFENRVSCTVGDPKAFYTSMYGQIGVSSKISEVDSKAICEK